MELVRFVQEPQLWRKAMTEREAGAPPVPLFALRALTPTTRDGDCISLYKLADDSEAASLAAAYWLIQKERFAMIAIDEEQLLASGAVLHESPGLTYHPEVNALHVDLEIKTAGDALKFARLFFEEGRLVPVEPKEIKTSIANDNASGLVDFHKITGDKKQPTVNHLCDLIHESRLVLTTPA